MKFRYQDSHSGRRAWRLTVFADFSEESYYDDAELIKEEKQTFKSKLNSLSSLDKSNISWYVWCSQFVVGHVRHSNSKLAPLHFKPTSTKFRYSYSS